MLQAADFADLFDTTGIFFEELRRFAEATGYALSVTAQVTNAKSGSPWSSLLQPFFDLLSSSWESAPANSVSIGVGWGVDENGLFEGSMRQAVRSSKSGDFMPEALRFFQDSISAFHEVKLDSIRNSLAPEYIVSMLGVLQAGYVGKAARDSGNFDIQLFNGEQRFSKDDFLLIAAEPAPAMPDIRVKPFRKDYAGDKEVEMRLEIIYQRDGKDNNGSPIVNLRNEKATYPPQDGWQSVKMNEDWRVDFGQDIRGGTAYLICRDSSREDTVRFYIRGDNAKPDKVKDYMKERGYYPQYWFIIRMTRQESSLWQFGPSGSYKKDKLTGSANAKGEPYYGPPRGFGLKQLDNWGAMEKKYAEPQHLWNWNANIDGGVEVIEEKKGYVRESRVTYEKIVSEWNHRNPNNRVSDSLKITGGDNMDTWVLTITEGKETFAANPTGKQRNIYDALWIKLFNGGPLYYRVVQDDTESKPRREIHRSNKKNTSKDYKNYVHDVCNRDD
jgi:hypothetical protein